MELHKIYRPLTAAPFRCSENYMEFEPCDALKPYVRCFWGTKRPVRQEGGGTIVTPDTCMDIIFRADFTDHKLESSFCGIDDRTFGSPDKRPEEKTVFTFAIRFYAWGAYWFAEESMRDTKNAFFDAAVHFPQIKKEIEKRLFEVTDICQMIPVAERVLLKQLRNRDERVLQPVSRMLERKGNLTVADLEQELVISERQLERLFREYIGITPKGLASLIRYQCLWSELLFKRDFHMPDAVYKYGYSDQAHLCHDFKKYHSMSVTEAREYAMGNVRI